MRLRVSAFRLLVTITLCGLLGFTTVAETALANSDLKNRISNVQKEQEQKNVEKKEKEKELAKVEQELKQLDAEIKKIDQEVAKTNQEIREKRTEIEKLRDQIEALQEEIAVLEARIAERDKLLKDRARSMYQSGGSVDYLEVLFGAKSFGDFLDRVNALTVIAQQDRTIIEAHIADQTELEEAKKEEEEKLSSLEVHLEELETLMANLEDQRAQKDTLIAKLEEKEIDLYSDIDKLENESDILKSQEAALQNELAAYERQQMQVANQGQTPSRGGGSSYVHSKPAITNAGFMRPATGSITSGFGPRSFSGGRMHYGVDIGKNGRSGDVPVVAVQDGTVVNAQYMNGYGNTVIIAHYVDGQLITTLYAHLESSSVSSGQRVSKGQTIGIMGNTGRSFGAHLHFEVHEGGWNGAKSNAVNPLNYIPN